MDKKDFKDFSEWSCKDREKEQYSSLGSNDIRRWYQRDIDQITHSTCFRKLQRKSQLLSEKDPRSRSRLIHTIEVSRIAMEISEKLGLSKELTEAICLAHDIGTSPYGHIGNSFLQSHAESAFSHEKAGAYMLLKISQKDAGDQANDIEALISEDSSSSMMQVQVPYFPYKLYASKIDDGQSEPQYYLHHISPEIVDGVRQHGDSGKPNTLEGQVVRFADNIAYLSQDIEDLITTQIIRKIDFTKYASKTYSNIQYSKQPTEKNPTPETHTMSWADIDEDSKEIGSLKDAFHETRGRRIAAFISRFVNYNLKQLKSDSAPFGSLNSRQSIVLDREIPILECDTGARFVIDFIWNFIECNYSKTLIKTSNCIQQEKMAQLWEIISDDGFCKDNKCYKNFIREMSHNSMFRSHDDGWKKAFFISHLSWFDVDLIIDSYHERNNTFELDISY